MPSKDVKRLLKEAEKQGWRVKPTKNGHYWLLAPDGSGRVLCPGTPSDHHAIDNTIAQLRKHGFQRKR